MKTRNKTWLGAIGIFALFFLNIPLSMAQVLDADAPKVVKTFFADESVSSRTTIEMPNGDLLIVGTIDLSTTTTAALLIRCTQTGSIIWAKKLQSINIESPRGMIATSDGGYAIIGTTTSATLGQEDIFLAKLDATGNLLWSKVYGGALEDRGFGLVETTDGHLLLAGSTRSFGSGQRDAFLLKTDLAGNLIWSKAYGGPENDNYFNIHKIGTEELILSGVTLSYGSGIHDFWLVKLDEQGNFIWGNAYGNTTDDHGLLVRQTPDGGFVTYGHSLSSGLGQFDGLIIKTDELGNMQWAKAFGGAAIDYSLSLIVNQDQEIIVGGYTESSGAGARDLFLVKVALDGTLLNARTYGQAGDEFFLWGSQQPLIELANQRLLFLGETQNGTNTEVLFMNLSMNQDDQCLGEDWALDFFDASSVQRPALPVIGNDLAAVADFNLVSSDHLLSENTICEPPVAAFVIPDTICAGSCITVVDTSTGMPDTWLWTFENANIASAQIQNPGNICFDLAGPQTVKLVVENAFGVDSLSKEIIVLAQPEVNLGRDSVLCIGDSILLDPVVADDFTFRWSDGFIELQRSISQSGLYILEVANGQCVTSDSLLVQNMTCDFPVADFTVTDTICVGSCVNITDISVGMPDTWTWTFENANPPNGQGPDPGQICFDTPGTYDLKLVVENSFGLDSITKELVVLAFPSLVLGDDTTLCEGDSLLVNPEVSGASTFQWSDGFPMQQRVITTAGLYTLQVSNNYCETDGSISVEISQCDVCNIYIPNAFSPNADGINDTFIPYFSCTPTDYNLQIFDRWGELVFESQSPEASSAWNGQFKGEPSMAGVYIYILSFAQEEGGTFKREQVSGELTLIR